MSTVLAPYINFRGQARDAMTFYQSVLGGELDITTFGSFGITQWPDQVDNIMHSRLISDAGFVLMGSDVPETMEVTFGDNVSVMLGGDDEAALTGYWQALSDGATILTPLEKAPWGDSFGQLVDRFGVKWLVNIAGSPESQV
ncbi:VOC family protein [Frondihabitans australicus]|uniref:PhnB protein n=1 Tax=Frondihabitans australicus TaxID=386892 RepID=A0A495IF60_9MICO|nr:VOC family protein [Frondihabitans australicus]RKR74399.1 PhnB protein [Frondihabitans australicus]